VEVQVEWNPTLKALRDAMAQLHPTLLYFVCPAVDTGDGSSGGLSLGALRLGGGNVEAGGVATQEDIAACTCSGGGARVDGCRRQHSERFQPRILWAFVFDVLLGAL